MILVHDRHVKSGIYQNFKTVQHWEKWVELIKATYLYMQSLETYIKHAFIYFWFS